MNVRLTRFIKTSDSFRMGAPWFWTLGLLAVVNVAASSFIERDPSLIPWLVAVSFGLVLGGLFLTFRRAWAAPSEFALRIGGERVELIDASGATLWGARRGALHVSREVFVSRSRWGTHHFVMLRLAPDAPTSIASVDVQSQTPLCIVNLHDPTTAEPSTRGLSPDYSIVMPSEFDVLERGLRR